MRFVLAVLVSLVLLGPTLAAHAQGVPPADQASPSAVQSPIASVKLVTLDNVLTVISISIATIAATLVLFPIVSQTSLVGGHTQRKIEKLVRDECALIKEQMIQSLSSSTSSRFAMMHSIEEVRIELWKLTKEEIDRSGANGPQLAEELARFMTDSLALWKIASGIPNPVYSGLGMINSRLNTLPANKRPQSVYRLLMTLYVDERLGDSENMAIADKICRRHFGKGLSA